MPGRSNISRKKDTNFNQGLTSLYLLFECHFQITGGRDSWKISEDYLGSLSKNRQIGALLFAALPFLREQQRSGRPKGG